MVPEATIDVAHGQMREPELAQAMLDFVSGATDVLVCTSIIESGRIATAHTANIAADISSQRLRRYFIKETGSYRMRKEIREMLIFAPQNVIRDPPFTKLDLLSCRTHLDGLVTIVAASSRSLVLLS